MIGGSSYLCEMIIQELNEEVTDKAIGLAAGSVEDYAAYKFKSGEVAGLKQAIDIIESVYKKYMES